MRLNGLNGLGDANREYGSLMERLPQRRIIDAEITRHRMDLEPWGCPDTLDGPLDLVEQGQHITGIARIALGDPVGKDETGGGLRHKAGFAAKLGGAIALAFEDGGNSGIVGVHDFTVAELFALGELGGLLAEVRMTAHRRVERIGQTLARGGAQRCRVRKEVLGLLPKRGDGFAKLQELLFSVAHQCHEDVPLPSALATKAPHDFFEFLLEALGLALELRGPAAAPLGDAFNQLEGFF